MMGIMGKAPSIDAIACQGQGIHLRVSALNGTYIDLTLLLHWRLSLPAAHLRASISCLGCGRWPLTTSCSSTPKLPGTITSVSIQWQCPHFSQLYAASSSRRTCRNALHLQMNTCEAALQGCALPRMGLHLYTSSAHGCARRSSLMCASSGAMYVRVPAHTTLKSCSCAS